MLDIGTAGLIAALGYAVVFFGITLLMIVITCIGGVFKAADKKKQAAAVETAVQPEPEAVAEPEAPGSAGQLKLYNVPPKTAAMLMAIVADKMGKPLNELRFLSIKEVE